MALYDSNDQVVFTETQPTGEYWILFDSPVTFRYELLSFSGTDWQGASEFMYFTPEPATVAILGLGSLVLLRRRRG